MKIRVNGAEVPIPRLLVMPRTRRRSANFSLPGDHRCLRTQGMPGR